MTDRPKGSSPIALAAAGAASLVVFAAAGWAIHGLRRDEPPAAKAAVVSEPVAQARGRLVFQVHCARCHGPSGHGDGPDAAALKPPPRDLTARWRSSPTRETARRTVADGLPGTAMPGLAAALSPRELDSVVDYVLSLAPVPDTAELLRGAGFQPGSNRTAPPLVASGAGSKTVSLDSLRGKLVLVVFWGTSCSPCLEEMPSLAALAEQFGGEGLAVVPLCVDETDLDVVRKVSGSRVPGLTVYVDPTGAAKLSYDVQALPSAALIAPDGRLIGQAAGVVRWGDAGVEALIRSNLPGKK